MNVRLVKPPIYTTSDHSDASIQFAGIRLTLFEITTSDRENPTDCSEVSETRSPDETEPDLERREPVRNEPVPLLVRGQIREARRRDDAHDVPRGHRDHPRCTRARQTALPHPEEARTHSS